ncbi:TetR/AcrR family transcriptional regulator [Caulobacter sp. SSI4214]|uniref:TetR/AcrR family transcriptional regulator n=1 Tax=Caulobacter sp. SSI4214 TaxID=2575739 RepID=UPI00143883D0|nr:TetR/AcrR family transcriptional regulator [Caulobacter sp. SSI4214]
MQAERHVRSQAREDQIALAAEACFQRGGFHGTAMSEIAKQAGVSVGQIYRHFTGKEDLIATIVRRDMERTLALVESAFTASDDKIATLVAQVRPAVERAADPSWGRLMLEIAAEASRNPSVAKALQAVDEGARLRLRAIMRSINGPDCDPDEIEARMEVLTLLLEGLPWRMVRNPAMNLDRFTEHLRRLLGSLMLIAPAKGGRTSS